MKILKKFLSNFEIYFSILPPHHDDRYNDRRDNRRDNRGFDNYNNRRNDYNRGPSNNNRNRDDHRRSNDYHNNNQNDRNNDRIQSWKNPTTDSWDNQRQEHSRNKHVQDSVPKDNADTWGAPPASNNQTDSLWKSGGSTDKDLGVRSGVDKVGAAEDNKNVVDNNEGGNPFNKLVNNLENTDLNDKKGDVNLPPGFNPGKGAGFLHAGNNRFTEEVDYNKRGGYFLVG